MNETKHMRDLGPQNLPQTFQMSYNLHRPWSDILFETTLPPIILEKMIEISDEVLADSKRIPWGKHLAGQVKEETLITPELLEKDNLTLKDKVSYTTYEKEKYKEKYEETLKEKEELEQGTRDTKKRSLLKPILDIFKMLKK